MSKYNVAVVGATGVVGQEMIKILEERKFPIKELFPLVSERSEGTKILFNDSYVTAKKLTESSFEGIDYALFSAGSGVSESFAPIAVKSGAVVIDNTSFFRMHDNIPLVVPEVNSTALKNHSGIIANPNCSTAQMVLALKPIHDAVTIERVVVSTYQSVSGAGKDAILELENQCRLSLNGQSFDNKLFVKPIAFNVIPQIDVMQDNGYTKEEMKMIEETKKILGDDSIQVSATCVRVPVFVGHAESVNIQTKDPLSVDQAKSLLANMPGIRVCDDDDYPTPRDCSGIDDTLVGRIRQDQSVKNGLDMWVVSDNLRKGAALNSVQIAECLAS